jgi:hypothetical protein
MQKCFKNENSSAPGEMLIFESFTPEPHNEDVEKSVDLIFMYKENVRES